MNKTKQSKVNQKRLYIIFLCVCLLSTILLIPYAQGKKDSGENTTSYAGDNDHKSNQNNPSGNNDGNTGKSDGEDLSSNDKGNSAPSDSNDETLEQRIHQKLSAMTLQQKVAQIFVITPEALTGYKTITAAGEVTSNALKSYPVGGLVYFGANLVTPDQLKTMTRNTQQYAEKIEGMPLFLGIDEEGGSVARIGNNRKFRVKKYSNMAFIGAAKDFNKAYEVGDTIGGYLHEYGVNLDFAPDADVLTNSNNTVIGNRSFGTDADLVAKMALETAQGLARNQVLSCFKHFPGHGATEGDTHEGYAYTNKTLNELKNSELVPFQAAADNHIPFIMVSHISVPNVIGNNTPSTLSKVMITDILRNQMGYDGIIITDAMNMGAIVNNYSNKEAVIQAIEAGADMVLMPQNFEEAYQGVLDAIADGTISEQRINESLERILRVKLNMNR
ncbi:MAG: glycoside hydrolase family 3 protein [Ignavibacteriales bacterium]